MVLLGVAIKSKGIYYYSKYMVLNIEDDLFIAQLLRDVDFSIILKKNQPITLDIVIYPKNDSYIKANIDHQYVNIFKKIGSYELLFDDLVENYFLNGLKKCTYRKNLDERYNINITLNAILVENNNYIVSTPILNGNKNYLNK
jgi:hypothetical protein